MWNQLVGKWFYFAGTTGTETIPNGAMITQIWATGGGTVRIFGGDDIPTVDGVALHLQFNHQLLTSKTGFADIVFTGTDAYYVEYVLPG